MDCRRRLYEAVVLSGGSTLYPGLPTRLDSEMRGLYLNRVLQGDTSGLGRLRLRVRDAPNRLHSVFEGGAALAAMMEVQPEMWISRDEFLEDPHAAMHKCGSA